MIQTFKVTIESKLTEREMYSYLSKALSMYTGTILPFESADIQYIKDNIINMNQHIVNMLTANVNNDKLEDDSFRELMRSVLLYKSLTGKEIEYIFKEMQ